MHVLSYEVTLLSPTIITSYSSHKNMVRTLDYIPGSSILGLFASKYIKRKRIIDNAHEDQTFYNWFLKGNINFLNAYILIKDKYKNRETLPIPLSIKKEKKGSKILNVLIDNAKYEQVERLSGYGNFNYDYIKIIEPKKRINFHHERSCRLKGVSDDGGIFNYEYLMPNQVFKGYISGDKKTLSKFKSEFGTCVSGRLGKSKGVEYGQVQIELMGIERLKFNNEELDNSLWKKERSILLTFLSPCIILNKYGKSDPSLYNLERHLENIFGDDVGFEITGSAIGSIFIENYLSVWNMKRPMEHAINCGSTIKLKFKDSINDNDVINILSLLEKQGLGRRRNEGFGQIKVNVAPYKIYYKNDDEIKVQKPTGPIPYTVREIFKSAIEKEIIEKTKRRAIKTINRFTDYNFYPKNALLTRLRFILNTFTLEDFFSEIKNLNKPAKEQLEGCINGEGENLYQIFLKDNKDIIKKILNNIDEEYKRLGCEIGINILDEKDKLTDIILKTYYMTLIDQLRQENKKRMVE